MRYFLEFLEKMDIWTVAGSPEGHILTNPGRWRCKMIKSIDPPQNHEPGDRWSQNPGFDVKIPLFLLNSLHWRIFLKKNWKSKVWSLGGLQTRGLVKILFGHRSKPIPRIWNWFSSRMEFLGVVGIRPISSSNSCWLLTGSEKYLFIFFSIFY